jgi:hypothetical protein
VRVEAKLAGVRHQGAHADARGVRINGEKVSDSGPSYAPGEYVACGEAWAARLVIE